VRRFLDFARARGTRRWRDISLELAVEHLERLRLDRAAEASVARALSAVRMCLRHQVLEGVLDRDPLANLEDRACAATSLTCSIRWRSSACSLSRVRPGARSFPAPHCSRSRRGGARISGRSACTTGINLLRVLAPPARAASRGSCPWAQRARALELWLKDGRARMHAGARRACS
jgi:hypothetical protein